jgi:threonine dehydrogenase-like Zn-dependent dehydrogenase
VRIGAFTEPLSGTWKGVVQCSEVQVGDEVVVIGVGGIGLLCLMVARAAGTGRLIAVDTSEYALANAKALGITPPVNLEGGTPNGRCTTSSPAARTSWSRPRARSKR